MDPMDTLLTQLSSSVSSARTLEDLTRPMLEMLEAVTGLESTYLTRIDLEQGLQHILYARNVRRLQIPEGLAVPWGDTLCKRALDEGRVYTDNVAECWGDSDAARELGIQTYVSTPVRTDSGGLYGTLCAASAERQPLPANATNVLGLFARLIGHQVEREQLFQRLSAANAELATHAATDALTGLPNRRYFEEYVDLLGRGRRVDDAVGILMVDVDRFKLLNDRHGHATGDIVLRAVARTIAAAVRDVDVPARYGGEEFVVLLRNPSRAVALEVGERIRVAVEGLDLRAAGVEKVTVSVGATVGDGGAERVPELVEAADRALYRAKRFGRNRVEAA